MVQVIPIHNKAYGKKRKMTIPKAVREQLWLRDIGKRYQGKCQTSWCKNTVTVHDFQCGHNVPESKGGPTVLDNLVVLCSRCNMSMANNYTFTEWTHQHYIPKVSFWKRWFACFFKKIENPFTR
jgi:5-methylcytosine-specific restriction endonuclease McrA